MMSKYNCTKDNAFMLYDYVPIGICIVENTYTIKYWNLCLEGWTGINRETIIGKNLLEIFPHLEDPKFKVRFDLMFEGRPPMVFSPLLHSYIFPIKNQNGEYHAQSATLTSLPCQESDSSDVVIAIEDVSSLLNRVSKYRQAKNQALEELTKRKEAEEKIKIYAAQLEELNATKDKFFSIIAHDLINPISTQYKMIASIVEDFDSYSSEEVQTILEQLNNTSNNTYKLLENLLTWSRSQLNKIRCVKEFANLNQILKSSIRAVEINAHNKKIRLTNSVNDDFNIYADVNMINTVLRNLISNAIKFTVSGGEVVISADEDDANSYVSVSDNGIGMPESITENLFRIDQSISTRGTNEESGTGLGLILCKDFIEKNKGKISVESELGKGTIFTVTLPKYSRILI